MKSILRKNFGPLYSTVSYMTQKVVTNEDAVTGSKFFVVAIFDTFGRYVTNLRGTFVENVKKVKISPPYCVAVARQSNNLNAMHLRLRLRHRC
jgi:S-adenosylmethionine hydrolase